MVCWVQLPVSQPVVFFARPVESCLHSDDQCDAGMDCTPSQSSRFQSLTTIDKVQGNHWCESISYCYCEWMNGSIDHDLDQWWFQCRWTRIHHNSTATLPLWGMTWHWLDDLIANWGNSNTTVSQSVISQWFNEDQVICETRIFSRHIPMMAIADI